MGMLTHVVAPELLLETAMEKESPAWPRSMAYAETKSRSAGPRSTTFWRRWRVSGQLQHDVPHALMKLDAKTRGLCCTAAVVLGLGWLGFELTQGRWILAPFAGLLIMLGLADFMASIENERALVASAYA